MVGANAGGAFSPFGDITTLMGTALGIYTFGAHLKWMPIVALGYAASIYAHMYINSSLF